MRLDKWLWAARFYKTRQVSVEAIERHRVEVNGQPCKPSREVRPGDRIRLQHKGRFDEFIQQKVQPMYSSPNSDRATSKKKASDSRRKSSKSCAVAAT